MSCIEIVQKREGNGLKPQSGFTIHIKEVRCGGEINIFKKIVLNIFSYEQNIYPVKDGVYYFDF